MVKSKDDMRCVIKSNLCGGKGDLSQLHLLEPEETGDRVSMFCEFTFNPGDEIGLHQHKHNAEVFYILEGDFELVDNAEKKKVSKGSVVFASDGDYHSIRYIGNEKGIIMAILFPN